MNANKNAVLKYSPFTSGLTRALKSHSARLHCNVDADGMIYICNGYFVVKLSSLEYDALVRPVTQRDAGNWALNDSGEISPDPINLVDALNDAAKLAAHAVTPAPMLFETSRSNSNGKFQLAGYYSETGDFVTAFNPVYTSVVSPALACKSGGDLNPMVIYNADSPVAMILPVNVSDKPNILRAVRAWFVDDASADGGKTAEKLRRQLDDLERIARQGESENADLRRQLEDLRQQYAQQHADGEYMQIQFDRLQSVVSDKNAEIASLLERLNAHPEAQPAPVEESQPEQAPADKAAALVEKLAALEGVTATIKGAQTASPVVWLTGEADAHKDEIEKLGGKWSAKRSAWYFKI